MSSNTESAFEFDSFRLFPIQRLLLDGANKCVLGSRAVEILIFLLERAGETVSKQELLRRIWPNSFVDETNLRVAVSALRKALNDGQAGRRYIVNLTGQGYCFVNPVRRVQASIPNLAQPAEIGAQHNLPSQSSRLLGRDHDLEAVSVQLPMRRCVTLAGPGGIGKTTLALAVAQRLMPVYDDGVWFVDLSGIADQQSILPSVAQVLGVSLRINGALASLVSHLQDKRLLLVLDNCEHVIDEAAKLTESILLDTRHVCVLATSRETLRVTGEWVHLLSPLGLPPEMTDLTAAEALSFPALRFFSERAAANVEGFTLRDSDVPVAIAICRGLDGLPLAIELAAARIDIFGLRGLASTLEEPFLLLSEGRRGALPRQQSLMRTLEWSYRLLSQVERTILRRLSVFRGEFTLNGALAIAAGDGIGTEEIYLGILTMSAKSLITSDMSDGPVHCRHRLLHVTRTLLGQKLRETTECATVLRRHAEYIRRLLTTAESDWDIMTRPAWLEVYTNSIADVRAAIDWSFSPEGDASLGVELTALAVPLGFQLSLIEEFRGRIERALLHSQRIHPPHLVSEMRLNVALGMLAHNAKGPLGARTAQIEHAIEVGRRLGQTAYEVEPLVGLATAHLSAGDYTAAIEVATRVINMAQLAAIPMAVLAAERVLAQAEHFNGNHVASALIAHRVIDHPAAKVPLAYNLTPVDRRVSMQIILARILWVQGQLGPADHLMQETIEFARRDGPFSLCPALAYGAIPIALWNGDDAQAASLTAVLAKQAKRYTLGYWLRWADAFDGALRTRSGEPDCVPVLSDAMQFETFATFSISFLTSEATTTDIGTSGWCSPEVRRVQGEWLLAQQAPNAAVAAEILFREALEMSGRQGAVSWELRASMSLARLWHADGRTRTAQELLASVMPKFAQQRRTADLTEAEILLASLSSETNSSKTAGKRPMRRRVADSRRASRQGR